MTAVFAYVTAPSVEEADRIGAALVEERLAACVNIVPGLHSVYRWQGAVEHAGEVPLLIKTTAARYDALQAAIRELHPYEVPEIIALPITHGLPAYLNWVAEETLKP